MASNQPITVGINVLATEQVSKAFGRIVSVMERFKGSMGKTQESIKEGLKVSTESSAKVEAVLPMAPTAQKSPDPSKNMNNMNFRGGGFSSIGKASGLVTDGIDGLTRTMRNFVFLLVGAGGATYGLKRFSEGMSSSVVDLVALEKRVGLPAQDIMRLGYVAQSSGVSIQTLRSALVSLADVQFDKKFNLNSESLKYVQALNQITKKPVSLLNPNGTRRDLKQVVSDILNALEQVHDPSLRAKLASQILGSEEMLKMGGPRFAELFNHFQGTGFSSATIEQAHNYQLAITDLDRTLDRLKFTAGSEIVKGFSDGLERSSHLIGDHHKNIENLARDFGEFLPTAMDKGFSGLKHLAEAFAAINNSIGLVKLALGTFAAYSLAKTIIGINALIKAVTELQALSLVSSLTGIAAKAAALSGSLLPVAAPLAGAALVMGNDTVKEIIGGKYTGGIRPNFSPDDFGPKFSKESTPAKESQPKAQENSSPQKETPETLIRLIFENAPSSMRVVEKRGSTPVITELGLNLGSAH